jgi:hypothetical protein
LLLSSLRRAAHNEAEKLDREALNIERRVLGPEHSDTLVSMVNLGRVLTEAGRYAEAEKLQREELTFDDASSDRNKRIQRCPGTTWAA